MNRFKIFALSCCLCLATVAVLFPSSASGDQITPTAAGFKVAGDNYVFEDVTTGNASTSAHGLLPKLNNVATDYLNGQGAWAAVAAGVASSRTLNTTSPITGGGDLSADRTFALDFTVAYTHTALAIGSTPTDRVTLANTTATTTASGAGSVQWSPAVAFSGRGSRNTAGVFTSSQNVDARNYLSTTAANSNPTGDLLWDFSIAGGAYATKMTLRNTGNVVFTGVLSGMTSISLPTGSATAPTLSFPSTQTGLYDASNAIGFTQGGTLALTLTASQASFAGAILGTSLNLGASIDLTREASGILQYGADAAAPTDYTVKVADGSGADKNGGNFTLAGGKATGTGAPGVVKVAASFTTTTGSGANAYATAVTVMGTLKTDFSQVANTGTAATNLFSYTIPANQLGANGNYIKAKFAGTFTANANLKQVKIKYGAATLFDSGSSAFNAGSFDADVVVARTGAATQKATVSWHSGNALLAASSAYTTPTETLSGTVALVLEATAATASSDITKEMALIEFSPTQQ